MRGSNSGTTRATSLAPSIYDLVLDAQLAAIDLVRPGVPYLDVHDRAVRVLTAGLVRLGLIPGPVEEAVSQERYKPFYMHRTSHWLGMDVHDVGSYFTGKEPRVLEPGMVLTVEPGLYIAPDADVEERWRGIGVRIEDDIAVTEIGHRNITAAIPKAPEELEHMLLARI